jgi:hypothetical protein
LKCQTSDLLLLSTDTCDASVATRNHSAEEWIGG